MADEDQARPEAPAKQRDPIAVLQLICQVAAALLLACQLTKRLDPASTPDHVQAMDAEQQTPLAQVLTSL